MSNFKTPALQDLPTTRQLNKATLIAAGAAVAILLTTVLPAEYGIDPTGIGSALGLTPMGKMKNEGSSSETAEAVTGSGTMNAPRNATKASPASAGTQTGEIALTLQPDQGEEVKATMRAGDEFTYSWSTDGAKVNFELHGEKFNAPADEYTTHEKGTSNLEEGTFRAPFDGTHGWFWRNRTDKPLTIKVKATGKFEKFVLVD